MCYASPASSAAFADDSGDDAATGDEAAGPECDAWILETPETGCTDDDIPGDDASDDDYMAYINLCSFDTAKDTCEEGSCAMVIGASGVTQSCQACEVTWTLADFKDQEGTGATKAVEMSEKNLLDDGSYYNCF